MDSKRCPTCKQDLPVERFGFKDKAKTRRGSWCKDCDREYKKKHYLERKQQYVAASVVRNNRLRAELRIFVFDYFKDHHCVDCDESDPIVLEFDHRNPQDKTKSVSRLISCQASKEVLKAEIDKCDVRCANCHRRKTAKESNWYASMNEVVNSLPKRKYRKANNHDE